MSTWMHRAWAALAGLALPAAFVVGAAAALVAGCSNDTPPSPASTAGVSAATVGEVQQAITCPSDCINGLSAKYWNVSSSGPFPPAIPTSAATLSRVDATVNLSASPGGGVTTDNFAARWTGQLFAEYTGTYTFQTVADDGIRLWVNSVLLVDNWSDHPGGITSTGTISLTAGTRYDITVEYYEHTGSQTAQLNWKTPVSSSFVLVPSNRLYSTSGTCSTCDDGNPCTIDACSGSACTHAAGNSGTTCRAAAAGGCDVAETCTGTSATCPTDTFAPSSTVCRPAAAGGCDVAEKCTGTSAACPADAYASSATVCRPAVAGGCDVAENCTGTSTACPADAYASSATVCRPAVAGGCDVAENCTGTSTACPADAYASILTVCRAAAAGGCDVAETCTGSSASCPTDGYAAAGVACADEGNTCTVDACDGTSVTCQHAIPGACQNGLTANYWNLSTSNGAYPPTFPVTASARTQIDSTVNLSASPGSPIGTDYFAARWTGQVLADFTGTYTFYTASNDGIRLWVNNVQLVNNWVDQSSTSTKSGTIALVAGNRYDVKIEYYDHTGSNVAQFSWMPPGATTSVIVPADHLFSASGTCTPCDDGNPCTADTCGSTACGHTNLGNGSACTGGTCQAGSCCTGCASGGACVALGSQTATQCGAAGAACASCDDGNPCTVDACNGSGACTHTPGNAGTTCRASAAACDAAEKCDGVSATCPADVNAAAGTVCRAVAGPCDVAETCTGTSNACPYDAYKSFLTACADDGDACTNDYCSGLAATCGHPKTLECSNGLSATYYDNMDFSGPSLNRIDATVDFDWGNGSPDSSIGADTYSVRWTGQVLASFSETYTFETETDDGARLWVNDVLLVDHFGVQGATKYSGTITLVAGQKYDIKFDYFENGGGASARLRWSSPSVAYGIIPADHLFPTGDKGRAGMAWIDSANNGTGDPYVIWRLSTTPGVAPVNASAESPNNWGLGDAVMMVPAFSPDGKRLVFIDGDNADASGWRKGLSTFDFDQTAKKFSNRRIVRNTWSTGDVMKWPVWEPDSRSVIFQTSTPTETCNCSTIYGNMAPTNYYGTIGDLWSIDANGGSAVKLTNLNTGERAADADKSYQPTVLPVAVGGYRWAVFTSTRPYGNTLNPPGIDRSCTASQLWVSAIDDTTSGSTDRSHPAFWLPNQNLGGNTQNSYINERGYWVLAPCKAAGTGPDSECVTNDDCCGAPTTAACRIDQPATVPPTRHCVAINPNVCVANGGSCGVDNDCCDFPKSHCIAGTCTPPAPVPNFDPGNFTRDYFGECPDGTSPTWRYFDWQTVTPGDSQIIFSARTATTAAGLDTAQPVVFGTAAGPTPQSWIGENVGEALINAGQRSQLYLRITMEFKPSSDKFQTPVLNKWRQSFSCLPSK